MSFALLMPLDCRMRVRGRDGTNRASPWNAQEDSLQPSMELYLTVMNRLAAHLGVVLIDQDDDDDDDDDKTSSSSSVSTTTTPISHWNVDILRGLAYPPQLISASLDPVVEWMPRKGIAAPGHVCLRLQGVADVDVESELTAPRRKKRLPVTLVFDACFRGRGGKSE